jgi:large subunit ribosomal protein L10e
MKGKNYRMSKGNLYTRAKYIHGQPVSKIVKFSMGDTKANYDYKITLISQMKIQVVHNALEAARISANKVLSDKLGETGYLMHIRVYPHIILRENKMIATAGADRLQEGMRRAFGKPTSRGAIIKHNQELIDVFVNESSLQLAKEALTACSKKLPMPCSITVERINEAPKQIEA